MLKIRDDIDLKELEKYGFKKVGDFYIREYKCNCSYFVKYYVRIRRMPGYAYYKEIWDCGEDKIGFVCSDRDNYTHVQDLIQAGLTEEVEKCE